jgi:hypothetical protein
MIKRADSQAVRRTACDLRTAGGHQIPPGVKTKKDPTNPSSSLRLDALESPEFAASEPANSQAAPQRGRGSQIPPGVAAPEPSCSWAAHDQPSDRS